MCKIILGEMFHLAQVNIQNHQKAEEITDKCP